MQSVIGQLQAYAEQFNCNLAKSANTFEADARCLQWQLISVNVHIAAIRSVSNDHRLFCYVGFQRSSHVCATWLIRTGVGIPAFPLRLTEPDIGYNLSRHRLEYG